MEKYGCDRPDMRYGLEMQDITEIVKDTTFQVFAKPIEDGGIVKCIKVSAQEQGGKRMSKGQIEKLTSIAQHHGLGGLAYIIVNENDLQSPIIKFLGEAIAAGIMSGSIENSDFYVCLLACLHSFFLFFSTDLLTQAK